MAKVERTGGVVLELTESEKDTLLTVLEVFDTYMDQLDSDETEEYQEEIDFVDELRGELEGA